MQTHHFSRCFTDVIASKNNVTSRYSDEYGRNILKQLRERQIMMHAPTQTQLSYQGRCFQMDFTLEHRNAGTIDSTRLVESIDPTFLCSKVKSI